MKRTWFLSIATISLSVSCMPAAAPASGDHEEHADHDARDGDADAHHHDDARLGDPSIIAAAARVRVLPGNVSCAAEVLGIVDVHEPMKSRDEALELLRRRAALLGAEAVTGVEFEHGDAKETHLSGSAVRCHDLLRGRTYDVLGPIEATAEMGREEDAIPRLNEQARAKGANLILDVRFEHGEGDRTTLKGTAVRAHAP